MKQVVQGDERKKPGRTLIASIRRIIQHQVTTSLETTQNQKERISKPKVVI
jgi:hypothetical protein